MKKFKWLAGMVFLMWITLGAQPSYAHKLVLEPVEEGTIKVYFEGGSIPQEMTVEVFNASGELLNQEPLSETGYFYFNEDKAHRIIVFDPMGHRVEWKVGDPIAFSSSWVDFFKKALVVALFIGIAAFFGIKKRQKV